MKTTTILLVKKEEWLNREVNFTYFLETPLYPFWQQRQEGEFLGKDGVKLRYVAFCHASHRRVIVVVPGRVESYLKYKELAYDLFHCGYDVFIYDHRGQGLSERLLSDSNKGHVVNFSDYVDDLQSFWQQKVQAPHYAQYYIVSHSMGGTVSALFLARQPQAVDAAVLVAPMLGIHFPLPHCLVMPMIQRGMGDPQRWEDYVITTGKWRGKSFYFNRLTHSRQRYAEDINLYTTYPVIQVGGPTYRWLKEALKSGIQVMEKVSAITTPLLLLQAECDRIVSNQRQWDFCHALSVAGHPCYGGQPYVIPNARHEILFEKDIMRTEALSVILRFFLEHAH